MRNSISSSGLQLSSWSCWVFESPLQEVHDAQNKERGMEHAAYLAVRTLATTKMAPLGSRHGRITKKCLGCEFNTVEQELRDLQFKNVVLQFQPQEGNSRTPDTHSQIQPAIPIAFYSYLDVCLYKKSHRRTERRNDGGVEKTRLC